MKYYVKGGPASHGRHGYVLSTANWDPYPMTNAIEAFTIAMANLDAAVAINSIAQQASPIGIGQREFLRTQFSAASKRVKITLPSILESYAVGRVSGIKEQ